MARVTRASSKTLEVCWLFYEGNPNQLNRRLFAIDVSQDELRLLMDLTGEQSTGCKP